MKGRITQTPFQSVILNHPVMRARYNTMLTSLLDGPLHMVNVFRFLDAASVAVGPHLQNDPYHRATVTDFEGLKPWLSARETQIRAQISVNGPPAPRAAY